MSTTKRPRILGLTTTALLVLALAGCGQDESAPAAKPSASTSTGPTTTSPPSTEPAGPVPTGEPSLPYILGGDLHVDGKTVAGGPYWQVRSGPQAWIAVDTSGHWWWGRGAKPMRIEASIDDVPVISGNGKYVGVTSLPNGITGFDTGFSGEGFGGHALDLGNRQNGTQVTVRAVTDDGLVIAQGGDTSVLWRPLIDGRLVDLSDSAPDQQVVAGAAGGLVVTDGFEDTAPAYLASIDEDGELTKLGDLPASDSLVTSPDGQSIVYTPIGTLGGEVRSVHTLGAQRLDGSGRSTLQLPGSWDFEVSSWVFEDDDYVVAAATSAKQGERMARCRVADATCVLIGPGDNEPASFTGKWLVHSGSLVIKDDHSAHSSHETSCPAAWGGSGCTREVDYKWTEEGNDLALLVLDVWVTDGTRKQFPDPPPPMSRGSFYTMTVEHDGSAKTRLQNDDGAVTGANGLGNPYLCRPGSEALRNGVCGA